jgi:serine protease Do
LTKELGLSETTGILITQVDNNSPAAEAGLKPGDIILEIDQAPARNLDDFLEKTKNYHEGDTILFLIKRGNSTLYLTLNID